MKRRNFLSGLLAAPLALKARFFARKPELCGAPLDNYRQLTPEQLRIARLFAQLLAERKPDPCKPSSLKQWEQWEKYMTRSRRSFLN